MFSHIATGLRSLINNAPALLNGSGHSSSEFWKQKMLTHFTRMDFNQDGKVCRSDFKALVKALASKASLSEQKAFLMQRLAIQLWEDFWCCGEDKGFEYAAPFEEFLHLMTNLVRLSDAKKHLEEPLCLLFGILDLSGTGIITEKEWLIYFDTMGLSAREATKSFRACFNNKAQVNKEDFVNTGISYFMTMDDKASSKAMYGPLVSSK